jgi:hypothetical protein
VIEPPSHLNASDWPAPYFRRPSAASKPLQPSRRTSSPHRFGAPSVCRSPSFHELCQPPVRIRASSAKPALRALSRPCLVRWSLDCPSAGPSTPVRALSCGLSCAPWKRRCGCGRNCARSPWCERRPTWPMRLACAWYFGSSSPNCWSGKTSCARWKVSSLPSKLGCVVRGRSFRQFSGDQRTRRGFQTGLPRQIRLA